MNNAYVIQWKNKVNGRAGKGTRQLTRDEAELLAEELNQEYPQILHEPVPWRESGPVSPEHSDTAVADEASGAMREPEEEESTASKSLPA